MFYDLEKHERTYLLPVGTMGFISYERLVKLFAEAGETRDFERITHFHIKDNGISFRVVSSE